ncbi:Zn-ribbon domain-containing OB-fold protein [Spirillospora sp. CA-294931]|uniref:Zn-ribbon domain-containing OB-fold protein n=1 Tax=Spirillospora sp. CA-294931 TaxID=3240042 RepID=UPI003D945270
MSPTPPAPVPSPLTAPYWAACGRGRLALQRCGGCARFVHFPEPSCPFCGGDDLAYERVDGRGTVHTFSVVHRSFLPGFAPPYVIAWIDLPEGARAFGDIVGRAPETVRIGQAVRADLSGPLPHWRPA